MSQVATDHRPCALIPVYNHEGPLPGVVASLQALSPVSYTHLTLPTTPYV